MSSTKTPIMHVLYSNYCEDEHLELNTGEAWHKIMSSLADCISDTRPLLMHGTAVTWQGPHEGAYRIKDIRR